MKNTKITSLVLAAFAVVAAVSCSVKEDRVECPCWLSVCLKDVSDKKDVTVSEWLDTKEMLSRETVAVQDYTCTPYYEKQVPKGYVSIAVYRGKTRMNIEDYKLMIPKGFDSDSLYAYCHRVDCSKESALDTAEIHKQFATVFLGMKNSNDGKPYPYTIRVKSDVSGFNLVTLEPVAGEFSYEPEPLGAEKNQFVFRLPRQMDDSFNIEILEKGTVIETMNLGKIIEEDKNYSWNALDLDDIYIGVDFALARVTLNIIPWQSGYTIDKFVI